jgi:hypothetical protein
MWLDFYFYFKIRHMFKISSNYVVGDLIKQNTHLIFYLFLNDSTINGVKRSFISHSFTFCY